MLAALLIAALVGQVAAISRQKTPVFDEPPHIASGLSYLAARVFYANPQHPPLLKELSAWSLSFANIHWPRTPLANEVTAGTPDGANMEWAVGNDILATNGPDRVLFWARLPFLFLAAMLGVVIYLWGQELAGPVAGLGALFLYALDPMFIAHAGFVTTDVGVTAFSVLFLFLLWRYIQRPGWTYAIVCGLALGAALGAKFTAVLLVPIAAILLFVSGRRAALGGFLVMCGVAALVIEAIYFFPASPLIYLTGASRLSSDHLVGQQAFFNGWLAPRFYSYFVAAYLLKEPLASIALAVGGFTLLWQRRTPTLTKLFLLLPPVVFVLTVTFFADDLGVRYIMPALPFAYLVGGLAVSALWDRAVTWGRPALAVLAAWLIVASIGIYPDHLSYFNEAACLLDTPGRIGFDGGSRCGPRWLDDSNVDWGQGVKQLKTWMAEHGAGRPLHLAYFGTFPPEHYGLAYEKLDPATLFSRPPAGLYAISAFWVGRLPAAISAVAPGATPWLDEIEPIAVVGHAFYIYDVK